MPRSLITLAIAPRHFSVVSGVSVNTLALNAVTPCVAKNAAILRSPASSAAFTSTPAAPCVCTSMNPGTRRRPSA